MTIKHKLHKIIYKLYIKIKFLFIRLCHKKIAFLIGTEDYGNLGDHHIAISELDYIKNVLKCYVYEISASKIEYYSDVLISIVRKSDLVFYTGGGNMGDEYYAEFQRRVVLKKLKDNNIIIFPETLHYSESSNQLMKTQDVINSCPNIHLFVREKYSYEFARQHFNANIHLVPDIVLSSYYGEVSNRDVITILLRHDIERKITNEDEDLIIANAKKYAELIEMADTQLEYNVSTQKRNSELSKIIGKVKKSKLVITDRLHGMVFCAITETPCIVLSNYNTKVIGVYEWLKHLKYIKYIDSVDELDEAIKELTELSPEDCVFDRKRILDEFKELNEVMRACWEAD